MIEMGKQYTTRDGRAVRILCVDVKGEQHPVYGLITYPSGVEILEHWTSEGKYYGKCEESSADLIPVPTKHEGWAVFWRDTHGFYVFTTREEAEEYCQRCSDADEPRGRVLPVTWEE